MKPWSRVRRARTGYTLVEMLMAVAVTALAAGGMYECIRTNFFLAAKNTGLNLSHAGLQRSADELANLVRGTLQIVDLGTFDGTRYTVVSETVAPGASAVANAFRFVRVMPVTLYLLPDDGQSYNETNPQNPASPSYPDYLTPGNHIVRATFNTAQGNLNDPWFLADLQGARLFPRFPYLVDQDGLPGLDLSGIPVVTGTNAAAIALTYGLPTAVKVPSCNQAFLVVVSMVAALNRGTGYAEMVYYPDFTNLARTSSMTRSLAVSQGGPGPTIFALLKTAGALSDPTARGSLQVTMAVNAPDLLNSVVRRGGTAAETNVSLVLPVEVRRRAFY